MEQIPHEIGGEREKIREDIRQVRLLIRQESDRILRPLFDRIINSTCPDSLKIFAMNHIQALLKRSLTYVGDSDTPPEDLDPLVWLEKQGF